MSDQTLLEQFMEARAKSVVGGAVFKAANSPASWDAETRTATFVMSAEVLDRDRDIVFTAGIDTTEFAKNPICLLNHWSDSPIGVWEGLKKAPKQLTGLARLAPEGKVEDADEVSALLDLGIMRACSIGFIPKIVKYVSNEETGGRSHWEITECELLECSIVSIPANPMALAKSAKETALCHSLIEEILDTYAKDPKTGMIVPKAAYEAAHKEAGGNKTVVTVDGKGLLAGFKEAIAEAMKGFGTAPATVIVDQQQKAITDEIGEQPTAEEIDEAKARARAVLAA